MKNRFVMLLVILCAFVLLASLAVAQEFGVKIKRPKPHEFGNVVIDNYSSKANRPPVVFKHWVHRAKYTCRLCHVDIGFAMKAGGTEITNEDNQRGIYCGVCHDGKISFGQLSPSGNGKDDLTSCGRCHSHNQVDSVFQQKVDPKYDFYAFQKTMPRERFGNGIDWQEAEEKKIIKLVDYIENVSIKGLKIKDPAELNMKPMEKDIPEIVFSHAKHGKWSGCELCHPEIFPVKQGSQPYSMEEIFTGKYCGVCHGAVAFPNIDCQRCHTSLVY